MIKRNNLNHNVSSINEYVSVKNINPPIQVVVKDVILINDYKLKIIYNNGATKDIELVNNSIKNFEYVSEGNKIIIETNNNDKFEIEIPIDGSKWELVEGLLRTKDGTKITLQDINEIDSDLGAEDKFLNKKGEFATIINGQSVTREELLTLISNNELIPNSSYRITNYTTKTVQTDTTSAGHDFDIIVTALSSNELSEDAKCVRKSGDTYFANAKLEAWEIKYCINNDTSRFYWADVINGKGVIYYMKDEWGNECPYDFKNIQFKKADVFLYTFGGATDNSLTGGCHHNTMMDYKPSSALRLNFNTFGTSCYGNTFGTGCYNNTFGNSCTNNTIGNYCTNNTFGNSCYSNTFDTSCSSNTFDRNCSSNTLGNNCGNNTFGRNCSSNTLGTSCGNNTFGNYCSDNTFDNTCYYNTFGNNCSSNTFGNDCKYNNFYTGTSGTTIKDYIKYIVLEDGCAWNNFYSSIITSSLSYLQRIRIKGLQNTSATNTQITLPAPNTNYEWLISYTSGGVLKQYCPNDLRNNYTYKIEDTIVSTWSASTAYAGYGYQAQINVVNLTENDIASVTFAGADVISGNYYPTIEQYDGYILVFSKVNTTIIIPTIEITKIEL